MQEGLSAISTSQKSIIIADNYKPSNSRSSYCYSCSRK